MAHGYRIFQQWDHWLAHHYLGSSVLSAESQLLSQWLEKHYGKHALLIGVPQQYDLLKSTPIPLHTLLTPLISKTPGLHVIEGDFHELPILTGSVDLVMLPHTLELIDNPQHLLHEACRIIKPEGLIAICGFNPISLWGLRRLFDNRTHLPWKANFLPARTVHHWLTLSDFELEKKSSTLYRPPVHSPLLHEKLHCLESIGRLCMPGVGGLYVLLARAKVVPLTPIRLKWKQQLSNIRISTTMSGHIAQSHQGEP